jgi:hypothetical protein
MKIFFRFGKQAVSDARLAFARHKNMRAERLPHGSKTGDVLEATFGLIARRSARPLLCALGMLRKMAHPHVSPAIALFHWF